MLPIYSVTRVSKSLQSFNKYEKGSTSQTIQKDLVCASKHVEHQFNDTCLHCLDKIKICCDDSCNKTATNN